MQVLPIIIAVTAVAAASAAGAQGSVGSNSVEFTLRGGLQAQPEYFGSDDLAYGPDVGVSDFRLQFGSRVIGGGPGEGFGLRPSFRFVSGRSSDDYSELSGLEDIDPSVELGLGVGYTARAFEAFADLRYGVIGHESLLGEAGADAVFRPTDRLTMRFGPRVLWGSDDYAATYFGVTPDGADASGGRFDSFEAESGALSAGVELGMTYQINEDWGIDGAVVYEQFIGSAADSPIVGQGSDEQLSIRLGVTRSVTFDF